MHNCNRLGPTGGSGIAPRAGFLHTHMPGCHMCHEPVHNPGSYRDGGERLLRDQAACGSCSWPVTGSCWLCRRGPRNCLWEKQAVSTGGGRGVPHTLTPLKFLILCFCCRKFRSIHSVCCKLQHLTSGTPLSAQSFSLGPRGRYLNSYFMRDACSLFAPSASFRPLLPPRALFKWRN